MARQPGVGGDLSPPSIGMGKGTALAINCTQLARSDPVAGAAGAAAAGEPGGAADPDHQVFVIGTSANRQGCRRSSDSDSLSWLHAWREEAVDIAAWLRGLGLEQYERAFLDHDIDVEILPQLTADDLIGLGVTSIGHRRKLLSAIAVLHPLEPPAATDLLAPIAPAAGRPARTERGQLITQPAAERPGRSSWSWDRQGAPGVWALLPLAPPMMIWLLFGLSYDLWPIHVSLDYLLVPLAAWLGWQHGRIGLGIVMVGAVPLLVDVNLAIFGTFHSPGLFFAWRSSADFSAPVSIVANVFVPTG
jgi:SAM domain (Sterile alpha motif)